MRKALAEIASLRPEAIVVFPSQLAIPHIERISEPPVKLRMPSISALKGLAEQGLLLAYGADIRELARQLAGYVEWIFKGARPSDLPVESPTKFELTVNMKTAKALQLTIRQSLLLRADERVECLGMRACTCRRSTPNRALERARWNEPSRR